MTDGHDHRLICQAQLGLFTDHQFLDAGNSRASLRRHLRRGDAQRVLPGVCRVAGAPDSWNQKLLAACLSLGGVGCKRTAAAVFGLAGIKRRHIEVMVRTRPRLTAYPGLIVCRTNYLPEADTTEVAGIPVTSASRTLLDLGDVAPSEVVRRALIDALEKRLVTGAQLEDQLRRCGKCGRPGTAIFRRVLGELELDQEFSDSDLEDLASELLVSRGYPAPVLHYEVRESGVLIGEVDLAYPERKLGIEVDSWAFHSSKPEFHRDRARGNSLVAHNWRILRFTNEDHLRPLRFLTDFDRCYTAQMSL